MGGPNMGQYNGLSKCGKTPYAHMDFRSPHCGQLTIWMTPCVPAARVKFSSPSGCPSLPRAVADYDINVIKVC